MSENKCRFGDDPYGPDYPKYLTNKEVDKIYELKPSCTFIEDLNKLLNKFIMSENKYYTPEITEFCVGMIYETEDDPTQGTWEQNEVETLSELHTLVGYNTKYIGKYSEIRVKYLDVEDIESLGFKYGEIPCEYNGRAGGFIKKIKEGVELIIECSLGYNNLVKIKRWDSKHNGYNVFFWGNIKNKQELKKVLQMIGVL